MLIALPEMLLHIIRAEIYPAPGPVASTTAGIDWIAYVLSGKTSSAHSLAMYRNFAETSKEAYSYESL